MVARVKNDMDKIDKQLGEAEATVDSSSSASTAALKSMMPSFIFVRIFSTTNSCLKLLHMMTQLFQNPRSLMMESSSTSSSVIQEFQPVPLFSTDEFFREDSIVKQPK